MGLRQALGWLEEACCGYADPAVSPPGVTAWVPLLHPGSTSPACHLAGRSAQSQLAGWPVWLVKLPVWVPIKCGGQGTMDRAKGPVSCGKQSGCLSGTGEASSISERPGPPFATVLPAGISLGLPLPCFLPGQRPCGVHPHLLGKSLARKVLCGVGRKHAREPGEHGWHFLICRPEQVERSKQEVVSALEIPE